MFADMFLFPSNCSVALFFIISYSAFEDAFYIVDLNVEKSPKGAFVTSFRK